MDDVFFLGGLASENIKERIDDAKVPTKYARRHEVKEVYVKCRQREQV
jgi:hypothetical protein